MIRFTLLTGPLDSWTEIRSVTEEIECRRSTTKPPASIFNVGRNFGFQPLCEGDAATVARQPSDLEQEVAGSIPGLYFVCDLFSSEEQVNILDTHKVFLFYILKHLKEPMNSSG